MFMVYDLPRREKEDQRHAKRKSDRCVSEREIAHFSPTGLPRIPIITISRLPGTYGKPQVLLEQDPKVADQKADNSGRAIPSVQAGRGFAHRGDWIWSRTFDLAAVLAIGVCQSNDDQSLRGRIPPVLARRGRSRSRDANDC